ncbi:DUF3231 family protein [Paenibacillus hexagrammi]|uniref:DUF3231 family protein n=1 Tax=Paenibacillus hexagrammi TaxID=2908839 RepID=A0ABY3SLV3_9BACL|nr:DUF3231 family protein [Paenibacillus sp. YPD9-1]UJF34832.1 DUF3231 family protein [Paenibacillus sp. YPD9-1]
MSFNPNPKLTSAEIAALWTQYMNETAGLCFNNFILQHIEDPEIRAIYEYAIHLGNQHIAKIKEFFQSEEFPVPIGFTEHDVNLHAPQLFSDVLSLHYLNIMSLHGCHGYSAAVTTSSRMDVRDYYTECLSSAAELCNRTKDSMLEKGFYFRPPTIPAPRLAEYVKDESFLTGWFGDKRPLNCIEITDILFNLKKSILAKAVTVGFSQVATTKEVRKFLLKASQIKDRHIQMFNSLLSEENLASPPTLESEISSSTHTPFSEKLMMFQVGFLFSSAMVYYGSGMASSPRRDLAPKYIIAITDDMKFGEDWMQIMIENQWLEQPPLAIDRLNLAATTK